PSIPPTILPNTSLFRSDRVHLHESDIVPVPGIFFARISKADEQNHRRLPSGSEAQSSFSSEASAFSSCFASLSAETTAAGAAMVADRKSTRLNSSHVKISYAVFCLKK